MMTFFSGLTENYMPLDERLRQSIENRIHSILLQSALKTTKKWHGEVVERPTMKWSIT
jgi:hypothetical protein